MKEASTRQARSTGERVMEPVVTLSVVIPTYRAQDLVTRTAGALANVPPDCELLVVDDGTAPGSAAELQTAIPHATVIGLDTNRGFGGAVNAGFQAAAGDYLATLNNDATTTWEDLRVLAEFLGDNPRVCAVAPAIVDTNGQPAAVAFRFPRPLWAQLPRLAETLAARRPTNAPAVGAEPRRVEYVKGACVVFRREALAHVGLFDEQFWMFAEEIDLFRRCANADWETWVVPAAKIEHDGGATTRNHPDRVESSRYRQQSYRSICRYFAKHHAAPVRLWLRFELVVRVLGRLLAEAIRVPLGRGDSWWVAEHWRCLKVLLSRQPSSPREARLEGVVGAD